MVQRTRPVPIYSAIGRTTFDARLVIEAVGPYDPHVPDPSVGEVLTWDGEYWAPGPGGGGGPTLVAGRRNHSVNAASIEAFDTTSPIMRTNTTLNGAGGFNGGGVGNKAILGHWIDAPLALSALASIELLIEQLTPEAGLAFTIPYLNAIVELDPVGYPGVLAVLSFGDTQNPLNLGTYTTPALNQHRTVWTPGANFLQVVSDKGMGPPQVSTPVPVAGPATVPISHGIAQPSNWNNHDYSLANLVVAYPNARIVNGSSLDGGMPRTTKTAGFLVTLGDSSTRIQNSVSLIEWKINGISV